MLACPIDDLLGGPDELFRERGIDPGDLVADFFLESAQMPSANLNVVARERLLGPSQGGH